MAHSFDTKANLPRGRSSSGRDLNYTCGAGATLLTLAICVSGLTARTGGAPTFNGVAMTQADQNRYYAGSGETISELWYLLDPPTGAQYVIHIPDDNNLYITAEASSYKAQAGYKTKLRTANGTSGSSTNPTGPTLTGLAAGDVIVACVGDGATSWAPTGRTGVQLYDVDDGSYGDGAQYYITPNSNNVAMAWTYGSSFTWGLVEAAFQEYYEKVVGGSMGLSLTPGAIIKQDLPVQQGNLAFSLILEATIETQMPLKYLVERGQVIVNQKLSEYGSRALPYAVDESGIVANTERPPAQDFYVDGDVLFSMAAGSQAIVEYVYQGAIGFSLTPQASIAREWVVQGSLSLSLMPGAAVTREWTFQGNVLLNVTPASTAIPEYVKAGAIVLSLLSASTSIPEYVRIGTFSFSLVPQSTAVQDSVVQGSVLFSLTPQSVSLFEISQTGNLVFNLTPGATSLPEYIITGTTSVVLLAGSSSVSDYVIQGNIPISFLPQSMVTRDWAIQGNISFSFIPGSSSIFEWAMTGALAITLTPNSSYVYEGALECVGNVVMALTPGASSTPEYLKTGSVQVAITPQSLAVCEIPYAGSVIFTLSPHSGITEDLVIAGTVGLVLSPYAAVVWDATIQGDVLISLLPGALSITEIPVQGELLFALTPEAQALAEYLCTGDVAFSLVPHSMAGTGTLEWEIMGDIVLSLILRGREMFIKPEGLYGYDWDPSKHFFVEGKNYDASLEFGLDKRLPIRESGDYKYDA